MDCLIAPSYTEGAGQAVIECIMSGLNVVVFKNIGHNYILNNDKKFICKTNSVKELYRLCCNFLNGNKNIIKKRIHKHQHFIRRNFSSSIVSIKLFEIIENILNEKN